MTLDRHDRKLLARLANEGPQLLSGGSERRAYDMCKAGLASRKWIVCYSSPTHCEYRWRYSVTDAGRAAISPVDASGG